MHKVRGLNFLLSQARSKLHFFFFNKGLLIKTTLITGEEENMYKVRVSPTDSHNNDQIREFLQPPETYPTLSKDKELNPQLIKTVLIITTVCSSNYV